MLIFVKLGKIGEIFLAVFSHVYATFLIAWATIVLCADLSLGFSPLTYLIIACFVAGIFVTGSQIHSAIRKRTIGKLIIFAIIDSIISIAVIYLAVFSIASLGLWGIAITVALFIAQSIFSFFEGWLIHGRKVIKLRKVLNFKNVFFLLLSTIVIILIGVGITALVNLANMIAVTAIIALTLFIVSQVVIACNAESYVITMVEHDAKDALKEKVQTK